MKRITSLILVTMLVVSLFVFVGCSNTDEMQQKIEDLQQVLQTQTEILTELQNKIDATNDLLLNMEKRLAKIDLDTYVLNKQKEEYSSAAWDKIQLYLKESKTAIDELTSKEQINTIVNTTKESIDAIQKGIVKEYSIPGAYEKGYLTVEDFKHIAYFVAGRVFKFVSDDNGLKREEVEFTSQIPTPQVADIPDYVLQAIKNYVCEQRGEAHVTDDWVIIYGYYGKFNNAYVLSWCFADMGWGEGIYYVKVEDYVYATSGPGEYVFVFE